MSPLTEPTKLTLAKGQPVPNDPYLYTNTVLLLHGDGANGSTNIVDSSRVVGSPKIVTPVGNAQISTAVADPFGNSTRGVLAFDGNGDYIQSASNASFAFGTDNFTIEFWAYLNSTSNQAFYETQVAGGSGSRNTGFVFALNSSKLNVFSAGSFKGASTTSLTSGTWHHIALVRFGNTWTYYLNGVADGNFTYSFNVLDSAFLCGRLTDGPDYFLNGYLDEYRITKGVARYTSNFTPPTAPFPDF